VCLVTLCFRAAFYPGPAESFFDYFAVGDFFSKYGLVVLASVVLVPVIMFDVLVTSNRFAGPLYRVRRAMRELAAGERVGAIQFREKDFLQDLADEFNAVAQRVEELEDELQAARRQAGKPEDFEPAAHP
jgi:signal transduction histidine kinase